MASYRADYPQIDFLASGSVAVSQAFATASQKDGETLTPAMLVAMLLIVGILLRSVTGALLILVLAALSAFVSLGALGWTRIPINSRCAHRCSLPDTQQAQDPHVINGLIATRAPCNAPSCTTPTASCPKTNGGTRRSSWPCQACMSDPQMPQNARSTTICWRSQTGAGTS